jgi:hypothetical protein
MRSVVCTFVVVDPPRIAGREHAVVNVLPVRDQERRKPEREVIEQPMPAVALPAENGAVVDRAVRPVRQLEPRPEYAPLDDGERSRLL